MAGNKRFRAGAWRLTVEGPPDPITAKRQQVYRTVREPNTRAGAKAADIELAKLVAEVDAQRVLPSSGVTVGQLMERWVAHHRPGWEERSPGQPDATLARIRNHITPKLGSVAIDRLRPIDVDNLYASDIDIDTATVTFTTALARVKGGTAEKGTKADVDYGLALDPKTVDIVRAHRKRAVGRALVAGGGLGDDAYVFARAETPDGSKPWHPGRSEPTLRPDPREGPGRREDHAPSVSPLDGHVDVRRRLRPSHGRRPWQMVVACPPNERVRPIPASWGTGSSQRACRAPRRRQWRIVSV